MNVALVHDYLNQYGGAERVLEGLMQIFPKAPIYTLLYDLKRLNGRFRGRVAGTSFLDVPLVRKHHRPFIPFMPLAAWNIKIPKEYDLVISDSASYAKGVRYGPEAFHLSYCHTPIRYAWEYGTYFRNPFFKAGAWPGFAYLRLWDRVAAGRPHALLANSRFIAEKIRAYYRREARVVYPAVDHRTFFYDPSSPKRGYWLAAGRLLPYKRFDLAIRAFAMLKLPLKVAGSGPEAPRLAALADEVGADVAFIPSPPDRVLRELYEGAEALVFPQEEDFGLVAVEAHACGTPVVAFRAGGAREIVEEGGNGVFFDEPTPEALARAVREAARMKFSPSLIAASSERFSFARFRDGILSALPPLYSSHII